ncbi:hypothetical protein STRIP9103_08140 [Streptomyces ipomoeae 91-03]|uniref:Uncharacterized protein n=1 Tax=Streptomyces ipomoeae 91-03 TaxID=698759 RepID=L1KXD9_9ACTN|nr:hypothetical protein STRIP9103_08140 [Streptomyces ipomoeae 91-03]
MSGAGGGHVPERTLDLGAVLGAVTGFLQDVPAANGLPELPAANGPLPTTWRSPARRCLSPPRARR